MTVYYSDRNFSGEVKHFLQKKFHRGELESNHLKIPRAGTIDYSLLLRYFTCALAKEHNSFLAAITLPDDLEGKIPSWYISKNEKEIFLDAQSGPSGKSVYMEDLFVIKFNFFINEKNVHKIPDTAEAPTEKTVIGQLLEIRHSLTHGNQEPLEVIREFYQNGEITTPTKTRTSKYLANILDFPH